MQLLESGAFGDFDRLHVAGHPEGNRDIDPDGGDMNECRSALYWKQKFSETPMRRWRSRRSSASRPRRSSTWADSLKEAGIDLPVHIGVAGPAKLQTLIKFAIACGVGPSLRVLQKRAMDVTKLLLPYEPTEFVADLAAHKAEQPRFQHRKRSFLSAWAASRQMRNGRWTMAINAPREQG